MALKEFLEGQSFPLRCDCPVCFNKNTFSAQQENGIIRYHCFHADCGIGGQIDGSITIDSFDNSNDNADETYVIPDYFTSPLQNPQCLRYMKHWPFLLEEYAKGLELYYDPKQQRLVFPLRDQQGVLKGATGRAISFGINPKWYIYDRIDACPYQIRRKNEVKQVVLVEDCISAIRLGNFYSSIALLSTNFSVECYKFLFSFERIYVALDDDATGKALKLQKEFSIIKPTFVIPLRKDLKYYNEEEMEEFLKCFD